MRVKPGYVATSAGSVLVFEVNSQFPDLPAGQPAQLLVTYTTSYDGWGKV